MIPPPPSSTLFPYTTLFRSLPLAEVLLGIPTAYVVVHRHARVPLRDLVQPAARVPFPPHAVGAVLGDLERVSELEARHLPRPERPVEIHTHHRAVQGGGERRLARLPARAPPPDRPDVGDRVPALEPAARETRIRRVDGGATAVGAVNVLVELQPQIAERVRRLVC